MKDKIVSIIIGAIALTYIAAAIVAGIAGQTFPAVMCGIAAGVFAYTGIKTWPK